MQILPVSTRFLLLGSVVVLAACQPLDLDIRGALGGLDTAEAARQATAKRPQADDRGIISYPSYQVAVARRGDTVANVAARVNTDAAALAKYNGVQINDTLNNGEVLALPRRVTEPSPATGSITTGPIQPPGVNISSLASGAIDRAGEQHIETKELPSATGAPQKVKIAHGIEPKRHKVKRGETAYTIARLYNVSVRSLAEWNGLGSDFAIREGQYLLIPVPDSSAIAAEQKAAIDKTEEPGVGTPVAPPPSSTKPLPAEKTEPVAKSAAETAKPVADLGKNQTKASTGGRFSYPVQGKIIRAYSKGKNDGIDIAASAGSPVMAAEAGTVAAITADPDQVPIIVVKHASNLLTVYANVDGITVKKGDKVKRGQKLAKIRSGKSAYVHFEVRKGFDSVDPLPYLEKQ
ncbi:LysM peptidoglycan-binding domain-containing M23 family metallopeptidase [Aquicoccus sp. G2-2]|uniref:LysM peptidoglycan-binding domain-containing M23 family metallopeptidase n=1 Tax=Aquicoccus sp. G2-2 TaxID=3092120 RepID=UPI002ADF3656|nr:LysM peptidoglycan-binding domain-containing M23 family metallopeptidase [Aquicoccus sp. G2-2]MEA1112917.1 LysM peptidoglycan-binding domain-containing M23 family metallopeptidase [Aquicoccus sp. G2-2]